MTAAYSTKINYEKRVTDTITFKDDIVTDQHTDEQKSS